MQFKMRKKYLCWFYSERDNFGVSPKYAPEICQNNPKLISTKGALDPSLRTGLLHAQVHVKGYRQTGIESKMRLKKM